MRRVALFPILVLAAACSDDDILQPGAAAPPDVVAAAAVPVTPANGGLVLRFVGTYVGPVDPGQMRITEGGVLHRTELTNGFALSGDVEGLQYWHGDVNLNLDNGKGPTIGQWIWYEFSSLLGQPVNGGFECRANGLIENYPGPEFTPGAGARASRVHLVRRHV